MSAITKPLPNRPALDGATIPEVCATLVPPRTLYRLTLEQYHKMVEAGVFDSDPRVELLDGLLIRKMTRHPPHDESLARLTRRLSRVLPEEWILRMQSAVSFQGNEPEPDFTIARGPEGTYSRRHPTPRDVELIIEVADSSYLADKTDKGVRYARVRIPQYWIVNIPGRRVEVYTSPKAGRAPGYQERKDYDEADAVPLALGGKPIALLPVRELLPNEP
jgi:Uma2 family endonuclease